MKILHIGKYYYPKKGGMENYLCDLCTAQVSQGHDVRVVVHNENKFARSVIAEINNVTVHKIRTYCEFLYVPLSFEFFFHLLKLIRSFKPDIIHAHLPNVSAFYLLLVPKIPIVIHWHSDVVYSKIDKRLSFFYRYYSLLEFILLKKSAVIISTSPNYAASSSALARYLDKTHVIPLALNIDRLPAVQDTEVEEIKKRFSGNIVLSVGRFTYYKGFESLISAAKLIKNGVVLIAGDGPLHDKMKNLVKELGVQDRVVLLGKVSDQDLVNYYAACDCFCLPSIERTEAFGLVLLEAMYFSKPLVTTNVHGSGMNYVNVDNETGLCASSKNPSSLAEKINTILDDSNKREKYGLAAKQRHDTKFKLDQTVKDISEIYSTIHTPPMSG